jgi:tetratricopeptide (TPR) repeat protein
VAVKLLLDSYTPDSAAARRFLDEARITGQLQHPGIPAVYQVGQLPDGRPFLAMKLIKGRTLDALLKEGAAVDTLSVFAAIAQAVGYAHAHGVIHRDLKPANVMVGVFGEVQVMDWGLAKILGRGVWERPQSDPEATTAASVVRSEHDADTPFTQYGSMLGTPAYVAPEQAVGELDKVGPPADVFGLGAILCVLLTGKPPYDGPDAESARIAAVRGQTAAALARLDACAADPEVIALCKRCLAFDPKDRPATADAVAAEVVRLRRAADERVRQAERDRLAAEVRTDEQARRRRALQWAAGAVAAVLLLGVIGTGIGLYQSNESRKTAVAAEEATEKKRQEAELARAEAQRNEAAATAAESFIRDRIFAATRPRGHEGGLGRDVKLLDAIAASLPELSRDFKEQPLAEARLRMSLGHTYDRLGDTPEATRQFERARELFAKALGPDDPQTLGAMHGLANNYGYASRFADALKLREAVYAARKKALPPDDLKVIKALAHLAVSYSQCGRLSEAIQAQEEALASYARLDPGSVSHAAAMNNLADFYTSAGRDADALALNQQALKIYEKHRPPDHLDRLWGVMMLADSYSRGGQHAKALPLYEDTHARYEKLLGPDNSLTRMCQDRLGKCRQEMNKSRQPE